MTPTPRNQATDANANTHVDLATVLSQQLDSLRLAGVHSLPAQPAPEAIQPPAEATTEPTQPTTPDPAPAVVHESPAAYSIQDTQNETPMPPTKAKIATNNALQVVCDEVRDCTQCEELASTRNKTVFGVGNPKARLCFLGEAPGADEDKTGEPFVGRAGKLLTKIIEACTLTRDDVYILNILKCRPPGNRNPTTEEMANCDGYLKRQLEIIKPEYICCLGAVSAKKLLNSELTIGNLRGKFHDWNGIKVLATYHPAYLLRNPPAKAEVWKDMQFLMKDMGIKVPQEK